MSDRNITGSQLGEMLLTTEEVADLMGVSQRKVHQLPLKRVQISPRVVRFRLRDVYDFLGIDSPNL